MVRQIKVRLDPNGRTSLSDWCLRIINRNFCKGEDYDG